MNNLEAITETLRKGSFKGYGHWSISIEIDGETHSCTTNNMPSFDAAFDEDDEDYEEARECLASEVLRKNDIEV